MVLLKGALLRIGNDYNDSDQKVISAFAKLMGKSTFNCKLVYSSGICYCFIGSEYTEEDINEINNILETAKKLSLTI